MLRLLLIGGTRFLGRHLAEQALAAGHEVTLLHRGRSGPQLFPQARHLIADRNGDLAVLRDAGPWDVAIDTCAYVPRHVRTLAAPLAGRVGQYQMVSTISVYADMDAAALTSEDAALATLADPRTEQITGETYGALKALCEAEAVAAFGASVALLPRPGLIVGPFDPTGRFTWWVQRALRGGEMLAPGDPAQPVQFIDARDLAAWMLHQAEAGTHGHFNLNGPAQPLPMQEFLDGLCRTLAPPGTTLTWVDEAFLQQHQVAPWTDLPLWLDAAQAGGHRSDIRRALASGLQIRPLADTLRDTAAWLQASGTPRTDPPGGPARPEVGLSAEREARLLRDWRARRPTAAV